MPLQSQAQRRYMHAKMPRMAARWEDETPTGRRALRKLTKQSRPKRRSKT